jgi:hypothetical protein
MFTTFTAAVQNSSQQALTWPYELQFTTATTPSYGYIQHRLRSRIRATSNGFCDVVVGGLDEDGDLDLLTVSGSNIAIRLNDGKGSFSSPSSVPSVGGISFRALTLGDVDGDRNLDLITSNLANRGER